MNRVRGLLAVVLLASLLAGCTGRGPEDPLETTGDGRVGAAGIQGAGHFAFDHPGGDIVLSMDGRGEAVVGLINGHDEPVSTVTFNPGASTSTIVPDQPAGEFVLRVGSINGTLRVDIPGDAAPRFLPLDRHVERFTLVERAPWTEALPPNNLPGTGNYQGMSERVPFNFSRPPDTLTLLASGQRVGLDVRVYSGPATILEYGGAGGDTAPFGPFLATPGNGPEFIVLPATPHLENLLSLQVEASLVAEHIDGALILQAESYSRARPPVPDGTQLVPDRPAFVYSGSLEARQPVRFEVAEGATRIAFFLPDNATPGEHATVALFGPHDERLATVQVARNGTIEVPVLEQHGDYVAVALEGRASVGADANPSDFELYPIRIVAATVPDAGPDGAPNRYTRERLPFSAEGTAFAVEAVIESVNAGGVDPGFMSSCSFDPGSLRLLSGGETIGFWEREEAAEMEAMDGTATRLLGPQLEIERDGFGNSCAYFVLEVSGYVREAATEEVEPALEGGSRPGPIHAPRVSREAAPVTAGLLRSVEVVAGDLDH